VAIRPDDLPAFLAARENLIYMRRDVLEKFSPDSLSVMEFQSRRDYEVAERIYGAWPLLGDVGGEILTPQSPRQVLERGLEGDDQAAFMERGLESGDQAELMAQGFEDSADSTPLLDTAAPPRHDMERGRRPQVAGGEDADGDNKRPTYAPTYTSTELWEKLKPLARQMRHEPTPAERVLWERLRNQQVARARFRRQHPIDKFIVDFYCAEAHLVIEVDGEIHDYRPDEDAARQAFLESLGLRVLRFRNDEVLGSLEAVVRRIEEEILTPKSPLQYLERGLEGEDKAALIERGFESGDQAAFVERGPEDSPGTISLSDTAAPPRHDMERGQRPQVAGGEDAAVPWSLRFTAEFHITNDRDLFVRQIPASTTATYLPLYEGKMIHHYDAYFAPPQYWLEEKAAQARLSKRYGVEPSELDYLKPRLAYRGIARSTDTRTLFAAILPPRVFSEGRSATTAIQSNLSGSQQLFTASCFNAFVLDWLLRAKVAANVNMFHIYSLPLPRLTAGDPFFDALVPRAAQLTCTRVEFAGLWQEVMGEPWDESKGATDPAERQRLRDEIDALAAHLYRLSRAEFDHILGTFPLVFPATDAGASRRAALLATYDRFAVPPFSAQS
jgi:very-short-patch-repair endonuclease